jgi:PadR family transcriptional regulator, regulatory protein PadR
MATKQNPSLLQGNLEMLILQTLDGGAKHGYGVARHIQLASGEALTIEEGSLYPALHRLERQGLIASEWGVSESNRRAKYYSLTRRGRASLKADIAAWRSAVAAIESVLKPSPTKNAARG